MNELKGQVAIVTGGSRGVGKGCALQLANAGATVYVSGRSAGVEQTANQVEARGGHGVAVVCDHADDEQVGNLFQQVDREQGRLDILINSAFCDPGISAGRPFWETPLSWYDELLEAGTRGAYVATHFAVSRMLAGGRGLVVNVSSLGAAHYFGHVAYGMGKAAVDKLTKDAARELRDHNVTLVSIWPYFVKTETVLDLAEKGAKLPLEGAESQSFVGRGVVALALDPDVHVRTGKPFTSLELAEFYNFRDEDGSLPLGSTVPRRG